MRMWMIDPKCMCRKHLLGEHLETHMFLGSIKKKISLSGYIDSNLLEPKKLKDRHDILSQEMILRGYNHKSPLEFDEEIMSYLPYKELNTKINKCKSAKDLLDRCTDCYNKYSELSGKVR